MPSEYRAIKKENIGSYGTRVGDYGKIFFEDIYSEKNHFIFELLQNAEDALARRQGPEASGVVRFDLRKDCLLVSHFGAPFTEEDVRGICAIAESTKDVNDIGRFGIGFKSVYAYTDRPEVHSGSEDFVIENFVWPEAADPIDRDPESTVFRFPLKDGGESSYGEISSGLAKLGPDALLFLRNIYEIIWADEDGLNGHYLRSQERMTDSVRRVTLMGGAPPFEIEEYMVFSRPVKSSVGADAGFVEIAFLLSDDRKAVSRVATSNLVAFFPTVVPTGLGFLVQGPYRTTPTRETVPREDSWNQSLVRETAKVLVEALRWFRDHELLDIEVLECLPLEKKGRFGPLFDATREALTSQALVPRADGGFIAGAEALLARGQGIRDLLDPERLAQVFPGKRAWVSEQITSDRAALLYGYLRNVISVEEITPTSMLRNLDQSFLEAQPDEWMARLYQFLDPRKKSLRTLLWSTYIIRLEDDTHVTPSTADVFLPGDVVTDYPTVKQTVCRSQEARHLLEFLNLREADHIDDIIENVLPIYRKDVIDVTDAAITAYTDHIRRILDVYNEASRQQIDRLMEQLSDARIALAIDYNNQRSFQRPGQVYHPTSTLKVIFNHIKEFSTGELSFTKGPGPWGGPIRKKRSRIYFLDIASISVDNEVLKELFERSGVASRLRVVTPPHGLRCRYTSEFLGNLRLKYKNDLPPFTKGRYTVHRSNKRDDRIIDWVVIGLDKALEDVVDRSLEDQKQFGKALWAELCLGRNKSIKSFHGWNPIMEQPADGVPMESKNILHGTYSWSFYNRVSSIEFPSHLLRKLRAMAWVVNDFGELCRPSEIEFDELGWEDDPELRQLLQFKTPEPVPDLVTKPPQDDVMDQLASRNGIKVNDLEQSIELVKKCQELGIAFSELDIMLEETQSSRTKKRSSDTKTSTDPVPAEGKTVFYREALAEVMSSDDREAANKHVFLPEGGPRTEESAAKDTQRSAVHGRSGSKRTRTSVSFIKSPDARKLEEKFREMAGGDYNGRCQVCGTAFVRPDGELSRFVTHIVDPARHRMSNHYGNLLSLCGLHHALVKWGRWSAIDAEGALVTSFLKAASEQVDDSGIAYIGVRILFMGLYPAWQPDSQHRDEVIRFSKPHWEYHRKLLETEEK